MLMVHPAAVCRVIVSVPARLTPSITSISPLLGQLGPKSQKAGHTPQMLPGLLISPLEIAGKRPRKLTCEQCLQ